uniref:Retrovirus-related Pol polyprotein from transposon TNT 1-94 n=1 Tax=Cajanus cajan TaxID=3821 RepID=A0A151R7E9_CAJCA|nr:Retrovirus-related Pol polyprotein from transposon TNT 1-94 [Cajanus cajan]
MDVKNAFLHGDLKEDIYITLPGGMLTLSPPNVCKLKRSLYGLKHTPRVWFEKFRSTLLSFSFTQSQYDPSLFLQRTPKGIVVLLVYVDDIVVTGSDPDAISKTQQMLHSTFHMKELGHLNYFLGLEVHYHPKGIFINQHKYIQDLVQLAGLTNATLIDTPMEVNVKYRRHEGELLDDPTQYRKLVGSLIYVTITRPDISFAVHTVSKFMQSPRHFHFSAVQRIIKYLLGTSRSGLFFPKISSLQLQAYSDAGCPDTRRSTIGWCMFLGNAPISWKCKKQDSVSKSSTEAEYRAMSVACSEIIWLRGLLTELGLSQAQPTPLHVDNTSAIQIAANPVYHERTKHIEVDCHSIRDAYDRRVINLPHVSTSIQIADIFTKTT